MAVDFLAFATDPGANVQSQADFAAAASTTDGFSAGIARSDQLNKVWRQSSFIAAGLANFVSNTTGSDVLDDGDLDAFIALLTEAVQKAGGGNMQVLTASGNFTVPDNVYRLRVRAWGAGGGGSGGIGGSGGGGEFAEAYVEAAPGDIIAYVIGAGGAGANNGAVAGNGGATNFGAFVIANGGTGGSGAGGAGGSGGTGTFIISGGGGTDLSGGTIEHAAGGDSPQGGSGGNVPGAGGAPNNGVVPGGGGGANAAVLLGANGANGRIVVEW